MRAEEFATHTAEELEAKANEHFVIAENFPAIHLNAVDARKTYGKLG